MMSYKIVFMGTPTFAVPALQALCTSKHMVEAVYCQPPKPQNRGHKIQLMPVHQIAQDKGIPVFTPIRFSKDSTAIQQLAQLNPDIIVVVAYGLILPKAVLDIPKYGCINIHGSLLPRWRGAAPIHRALLEGDHETGITTMLMNEGLDTGDMLLRSSLAIKPTHTLQQLHDELAELGARLIVETLDHFDTITPIPQPEKGVTYASKIQKHEGLIDWNQSADYISRQVRAFNPWPGAYTYYKNQIIKILDATLIDASGPAGQILDQQLLVACGQGALRIHRLQRQGSKPMNAKDFLNGMPIPSGESFAHASL